MPDNPLCSRCRKEPAGPFGVCAACLSEEVELPVRRGKLERCLREAIVITLETLTPTPFAFIFRLGISFWRIFHSLPENERKELISVAGGNEVAGQVATRLAPELSGSPHLKDNSAAEDVVSRLVDSVAHCPSHADLRTVEKVLNERLMSSVDGPPLRLPPTRKQRLTTTLAARRMRRVELQDMSRLPVVPGYRVIAPLGEGGQGFVLHVVHVESGEHRALKLRPYSSRALVANELCRKLRHPNIVAWCEDGEVVDADGHRWSYVVQRPVCLGTLRDAIDQGIDRELALCLAGQMLEGLAHAHEEKILHRDLKPSNLLLQLSDVQDGDLFDSDMRVRVADLGLARDTSAPRLTRTYQGVLGTHLYISPEHITEVHGGDALGFYSDVWCCGLVIQEVLCGALPYPRFLDESGLAWRLRGWQYTPPTELPRPLQDFLRGCLQLDPRERWQTAGEALEAYREACADELGRLRHERYRPSWQKIRDEGLLQRFLARRREPDEADESVLCAQALAEAGVEQIDPSRLPRLLDELRDPVRKAAQARAGARKQDAALLAKIARPPKKRNGATWTALGRALISGGERITAQLVAAQRGPREVAERLLAPLCAEWQASAARTLRQPGGRGSEIAGFTLLGTETFRCPNDVEGERAFTVEVYRCEAWAQALIKSGALAGVPDTIGAAKDLEFVKLPPAGYGDSQPPWSGAPFLIARTAVSQRVYTALGGAHDKFRWAGALLPANEVSWEDVTAWLEGLGQRLPSEQESEFACRAGTTTAFCFGDGKTVTSAKVNFNGNYPTGGAKKSDHRKKTVEVGSLPGNAFGLHEVHGNLWEWCRDLYKAGGSSRVLRGGSWNDGASVCASRSRIWDVPGARSWYIGFRPAVTLGPS